MRKRKDANHNLIANEFTARGATFQDLSQYPKQLDGLVGFRGINRWIEIKDGDKPPSARKLTPAENEIFETWGGTVERVETTKDVERVLRAMAEEALILARSRINRGGI